MNKVAIMTDTITYMPLGIAEEYGIKVVPMQVVIEGKSYPENEIDLPWFYEQLPKWKETGNLPTSSSIAIGAFLEAYRELSQQAEGILYIGHSKKLGMSINSALQAKAQVQAELPQTAVEVVDPQVACGAQMLVALEAAKAAGAGRSLSEVVQVANNVVKRANFIALMDDLSLLAKGGRIHKASPWAATKITNTAFLDMNVATGGEFVPLARCKTKGQTLKTLFDVVKQRSGGKRLHVAINHADAPAEAEELKERFLSRFPCAEVFVSQIGALVTFYTGIGTRLVNWWSED